ncbi:hypothetical protein YTPLAS18_28030 [Nitrospira sp.]|nr:hypothetical protein YTPLAS18_28030 [Nitrospira sp.]
MSADGRFVAFDSVATNLVPGLNTNNRRQVYVRDRQTNITELVSVNSQGLPGNGDSFAPVISDDGQTVVFESLASNLIFGDTNDASDIFLRDRTTRLTERISQFTSGIQGTCSGTGLACSSFEPSINSDATVIAFGSASRLVNDDVDNQTDIYVLQRGGTLEMQRITVPAGLSSPPPNQGNPSVSADGQFVAFASTSSQLATVVNTTDTVSDIFLYEISTKTTRKVTIPFSGFPADGNSFWPSISGDGRFVAFWSNATNLTATFRPTTGLANVFVADMQTSVPSISIISLGLGNQSGNGDSQFPSISRDGNFITFVSNANNFDTATTDSNSLFDVYRSERACMPCRTTRVTIALAGRDVDLNSYGPTISEDGRTIAYFSDATTLVPADTNGVRDAFLRVMP